MNLSSSNYYFKLFILRGCLSITIVQWMSPVWRISGYKGYKGLESFLSPDLQDTDSWCLWYVRGWCFKLICIFMTPLEFAPLYRLVVARNQSTSTESRYCCQLSTISTRMKLSEFQNISKFNMVDRVRLARPLHYSNDLRPRWKISNPTQHMLPFYFHYLCPHFLYLDFVFAEPNSTHLFDINN